MLRANVPRAAPTRTGPAFSRHVVGAPVADLARIFEGSGPIAQRARPIAPARAWRRRVALEAAHAQRATHTGHRNPVLR